MIAVVVLFLAAAAQALPTPQITSFSHPGKSVYMDPSGQYLTQERSHTGAVVNDRGSLKNAADGTLVLVRDGHLSYTSPEGVPVQISYYADETGYHATGNVIPTAPVAQQVPQRF